MICTVHTCSCGYVRRRRVTTTPVDCFTDRKTANVVVLSNVIGNIVIKTNNGFRYYYPFDLCGWIISI